MPATFRRLGTLRSDRSVTAQKSLAAKLSLETLGDRIVPATFTVSNLADAGAGSLRQAVLDANATPGADDIEFTGAGATGTIVLTSGEIDITDSLTVNGPGATALTIDGNANRPHLRHCEQVLAN